MSELAHTNPWDLPEKERERSCIKLERLKFRKYEGNQTAVFFGVYTVTEESEGREELRLECSPLVREHNLTQ